MKPQPRSLHSTLGGLALALSLGAWSCGGDSKGGSGSTPESGGATSATGGRAGTTGGSPSARGGAAATGGRVAGGAAAIGGMSPGATGGSGGCPAGQSWCHGCEPGQGSCGESCPGFVCPSCGDQLTVEGCEAMSECHAVFIDEDDCDCAAPGCCARFSFCTDGAQAMCEPPTPFTCLAATPHCEEPAYVISYSPLCYEGCVDPKDCAP